MKHTVYITLKLVACLVVQAGSYVCRSAHDRGTFTITSTQPFLCTIAIKLIATLKSLFTQPCFIYNILKLIPYTKKFVKRKYAYYLRYRSLKGNAALNSPKNSISQSTFRTLETDRQLQQIREFSR